MNRQEAKQYIKENIEDYLNQRGINTNKNFCCLNPEHADRDPSMSLDRKRNKAHCFSCGVDYDIFDLIGIEYGITDNKAIFDKAYELYKIPLDSEKQSGGKLLDSDAEKSCKKDTKKTPNAEKPLKDYSEYLKAAHSNIHKTDYLKKRGITSDIAERFCIGYDEHFTEGTNGSEWKAIIIPTGNGSFVARNTDSTADKKSRYRKVNNVQIFNSEALNKTDKPVFIVEGEIDALSIIQCGGYAVGLGSTANKNKFISLVQNKRPFMPLLLALDNDESGQKTADDILTDLQKNNIRAYKVNVFGNKKDANEALQSDKANFEKALREAENLEKIKYLKTSAAGYLQAFIDGIKDSVNTPVIPTGFKNLDGLLDGGICEGLYIIGAISSLGKTTFALQMADNIAASGHDVLIFSLEMARNELIAKSLSRLTLCNVILNNIKPSYAKTERGITTASRYANYCKEEIELINQAAKKYSEYAERIFIYEGVGDIGALQIRSSIEKHISITGNKPIVLIDYLQILAPYSDRATDKQNIDRSVLELKRASRDYKIPIIGISSLNRDGYKKAVSMESFKESGAIEYTSDVLIGMQLKGAEEKDFNIDSAKSKDEREIELKILKNRHGVSGKKIDFKYIPAFNDFKEV